MKKKELLICDGQIHNTEKHKTYNYIYKGKVYLLTSSQTMIAQAIQHSLALLSEARHFTRV